MNFLKIRILLPALFGVTVFFSLIQGVTSILSVEEMDKQADNIVLRMERSLAIADLGDRLNDIRRNYLTVMTAATPEARNALFQRTLQSQEERAKAFEAYAAGLKIPHIREKFERLSAAVTNYESMGAELKKVLVAGDTDAAAALIGRMNQSATAAPS